MYLTFKAGAGTFLDDPTKAGFEGGLQKDPQTVASQWPRVPVE
jgi:hypothetical protein